MPESWYFEGSLDKSRRQPNAYRKRQAQESLRTSEGVVLADTASFSAARGLLAEGTGDFGEDATALFENGEGRETNDNNFDRPRATCSHGTTIEMNTRAEVHPRRMGVAMAKDFARV